MDGADGTRHFDDEQSSREQSPSLLTIVLDTNPAAWALLHPTLSLSSAVANILVFINAHLACNYTNQVAVIASHCDKAQWLYPTAAIQTPPSKNKDRSKAPRGAQDEDDDGDGPANRKRARLNGMAKSSMQGKLPAVSSSDKYRPFHLIEEELIRNLKTLMTSTTPEAIQGKTSTMIAGALTLALSYINRRSQEHQESLTGISTNLADQSAVTATDPSNNPTNALQSRILIVTLSPSTDLAHQYIPIMNAIFACQRLNIPIDVLHLPLPPDPSTKPQQAQSSTATATTTTTSNPASAADNHSPTVFLQQATDATHGIFLAAKLTPTIPSPQAQAPSTDDKPSTSLAQSSMLTYLMTAFLPTPANRLHLVPPTLIDVDFRAACFCHRAVIDTGYVCSICLSIFCDRSLATLAAEGCLTCGTNLGVRDDGLGGWTGGKRPVVVAPKKKKKKKSRGAPGEGLGSAIGTPRPGTPAVG